MRILLLVVVALLATAAPASAHVRLLASNPEPGQALAKPPQSIQLTFDEQLKAPPGITVTDPNGTQWAMGRPTMDNKVVTVPVDAQQGPAGKYTVNYRVTGLDNHLIIGDIRFDITAPFGQPQAAAPEHQQVSGSTSDSKGLPSWLWFVIGLALLGAAAGVMLLVRKGDKSGL